jgi:hypothetical protein
VEVEEGEGELKIGNRRIWRWRSDCSRFSGGPGGLDYELKGKRETKEKQVLYSKNTRMKYGRKKIYKSCH